MTPRQKMFRRIWLAAGLAPVEMTFRSKAEATSFKLKMYAWARPYRADRMLDQDLSQAKIEDMEIVMKEDKSQGEWRVRVQYAWDNPELQRLAGQAGIAFGPDAEALESMQSFIRGLEEKERIEGIGKEVVPLKALEPQTEEEKTEAERLAVEAAYEKRLAAEFEQMNAGDPYANE